VTTRKRVDPDRDRLDRVVAEARRARDERQQGYRGQALKLFPWICGQRTPAPARHPTRRRWRPLYRHHSHALCRPRRTPEARGL